MGGQEYMGDQWIESDFHAVVVNTMINRIEDAILCRPRHPAAIAAATDAVPANGDNTR